MPVYFPARIFVFAVSLVLGTAEFMTAQTAPASAVTGGLARPTAPSPGLPLATSPSAVSVPHVFAPTMPRTTYSRYPWKTDIVATVFWIGEEPTENNPTPNDKSSWDTAWKTSYGGYDDPDPAKRTTGYTPAAFLPKQNPFYIALPYNDVLDYNSTKPDAKAFIPWFNQRFTKHGKTVLKGQWLAIRYGNRVCYAQWEDCGPFVTDDVAYVFGSARPKNPNNNGAGLDISPSVRDYLGMKSGAKCDWRFVDLNEIPAGPWRSYGTNNPFIRAKADEKNALSTRLDELRRMRDDYFRKNGNNR